MAAVNLGVIGLVPKGDYSPTATYTKGNIVTFNGSSYIAKTTVPAGILPTNTNYYQLCANGSASAALQNMADIEPISAASQVYGVGEYLIYNDVLYKTTAAVAIGDALAPGTNIEAVNIGEELVSKLNAANVVNNLTTTEAGFVLDARQGKLLIPKTPGFGQSVQGTANIPIVFSNYTFVAFFAAAGNGTLYSACGMVPARFLHNGRYIDVGSNQTFRVLCGDNVVNLNKFVFNDTDHTNNCTFFVYAW